MYLENFSVWLAAGAYLTNLGPGPCYSTWSGPVRPDIGIIWPDIRLGN